VEDPSLDAIEVYSDWDYYSDDYYDDDLSILRRQRRVVDVLHEAETLGIEKDGDTTKLERKFFIDREKTTAVPLSTSLSDPVMDQTTFKGVIWKTPFSTTEKAISLYEPGHGETVALFKNWREVFKDSHARTSGNWRAAGNIPNHRKTSRDTDAYRVRKSKSCKVVTVPQLDNELSDNLSNYKALEGEEGLSPQLDTPAGRELSPPPSIISELGRPLASSDHRIPAIRPSKPAPSRLREVVIEDSEESEKGGAINSSRYEAEECEEALGESDNIHASPPIQEMLHVAVPPPPDIAMPDRRKRKRDESMTEIEDSTSKRTASVTQVKGRGRGRPKKEGRSQVSTSSSTGVLPSLPNDGKAKRAASPTLTPTGRSKRTRKSAK
jgi:hypothetical protein